MVKPDVVNHKGLVKLVYLKTDHHGGKARLWMACIQNILFLHNREGQQPVCFDLGLDLRQGLRFPGAYAWMLSTSTG